MRELNVNETARVNGGGISGFSAEGFAWGTIGGAILEGGAAGVARGGAFGALMGATFGAGYAAGNAMGASSLGSRLGRWLYMRSH